MPSNAIPDATFSSHLHNDWTYAQVDSESESDSEEESLVQKDADGELDHYMPVFETQKAEGDAAQGGYQRSMPERFSESSDDRLMNSMIKNYALEVKNEDGKPSGHFFVDRDNAYRASEEVVRTHMFKEDKKVQSFLSEKFSDTWNHFDVNKDGLVEVERMPQFLRFMLGNSLEINLQ